MRAWLISFRWQLFLIRKAVRIQAAFVACAFETSLKLCSTLYTQEVHSEQPCVCETWHIQSTEGHDFRQSISQTTITYTHLHPEYLLLLLLWDGRLIRKSLPFSLCSNSANSSVTKLKSAHKIGTTVVFGAPVQISIAIGHTIAHVLVFYCCCFCFLYVVFYFWVFRFSLRAWKKELQPWRSRNPQCEPNWGYSTTTARQPDELTFQACMWASVCACVCICIRAVTHVSGSFIHS